jgi:hypothetical protein
MPFGICDELSFKKCRGCRFYFFLVQTPPLKQAFAGENPDEKVSFQDLSKPRPDKKWSRGGTSKACPDKKWSHGGTSKGRPKKSGAVEVHPKPAQKKSGAMEVRPKVARRKVEPWRYIAFKLPFYQPVLKKKITRKEWRTNLKTDIISLFIQRK